MKPRIALIVVCRLNSGEISVRSIFDCHDIMYLPSNRKTYGREWLIIGARTEEGAKRAFETYLRQGPKLEFGQSLITE